MIIQYDNLKLDLPSLIHNSTGHHKEYLSGLYSKLLILFQNPETTSFLYSFFKNKFKTSDKNTHIIYDFILSNIENSHTFVEFLQSHQLDILSFLNLNSKSNIVNILKNTGINNSNILKILNFSISTSPSMGAGEILYTLCFANAYKSYNSGDIIVENIPIEIKGKSGRLKGQKGTYIQTDKARQHIESILKETFGILSFENIKDTYWNFNSNNNGIIKIFQKYFKPTVKYIEQISEILWKIFGTGGICYDIDIKYKKDIIEKFKTCFNIQNNECIIDEYKLKTIICEIYFLYYHQYESVNYILFFNPKGDFIFYNSQWDFSQFLINNKFNLITPNFSNSAGSQGGIFGLSLPH